MFLTVSDINATFSGTSNASWSADMSLIICSDFCLFSFLFVLKEEKKGQRKKKKQDDEKKKKKKTAMELLLFFFLKKNVSSRTLAHGESNIAIDTRMSRSYSQRGAWGVLDARRDGKQRSARAREVSFLSLVEEKKQKNESHEKTAPSKASSSSSPSSFSVVSLARSLARCCFSDL